MDHIVIGDIPLINYKQGLLKLYDQVHLQKTIDSEYITSLADDSSETILKWAFNKYSKWFVNKDLIDIEHPFYEYISRDSWPEDAVCQKFH